MDQPAPAAVRARRSVATATGAVLALRVAAAAAGLGFGVAVARVFGASLTGVLAIGITVSLVGKLLGELGVATPMLREVAAAADRDDWPAVAGVYRRGVGMAAAASLAVAAALWVAAPPLAQAVFGAPELAGVLRILAVGVAPGVLVTIHAALLRAVHRPAAAAAFDGLGQYAIATAVLLVAGGRFGIAAAAWGLVAGSVAMLAASWATWRRCREPAGSPEPVATRPLLAAGLPVLVVMGAFLLIEWTDTVMVGILAGTADVGVYTAAARTAAIVGFVLHATNAVTAPRYAAHHARSDTPAMRRLAATSTRSMLVVAVPVAVALMAGARPVLGLFGPEFVAGTAVLAILAAAQLASVAAGSVGTILTMTGNERRLRDVMVLAGGANVAFNALLIPVWGPEGAAVATACSLVGANAAAFLLVRRRLGFTTLPSPARANG